MRFKELITLVDGTENVVVNAAENVMLYRGKAKDYSALEKFYECEISLIGVSVYEELIITLKVDDSEFV